MNPIDRTRDRLMHDGESLTRNEAILRHAGEATFVINNYRNLSTNSEEPAHYVHQFVVDLYFKPGEAGRPPASPAPATHHS